MNYVEFTKYRSGRLTITQSHSNYLDPISEVFVSSINARKAIYRGINDKTITMLSGNAIYLFKEEDNTTITIGYHWDIGEDSYNKDEVQIQKDVLLNLMDRWDDLVQQGFVKIILFQKENGDIELEGTSKDPQDMLPH